MPPAAETGWPTRAAPQRPPAHVGSLALDHAHRRPWRDLPERYGPWQAVYSRLRLWRRTGVLDRLLAGLQEGAGAEGLLGWELHHVDGTVVQAHQHAAGGKKGTPAQKPLDQVVAGFLPGFTSVATIMVI